MRTTPLGWPTATPTTAAPPLLSMICDGDLDMGETLPSVTYLTQAFRSTRLRHSGLRFGMARSRDDTSWSQCSAAWQRLAWARSTDGRYPTPTSFARAVGEKPHTYAAYERDPDTASKKTKLDYAHAVAWADKLDIRWEWLFRGDGAPWRDAATPLDRIDGLLRGLPPEDQERYVAAFELIVKRSGVGG